MNKREKLLSQKTLAEFFLTSASLRYGKTAYITKDSKGAYTKHVTYAELMEHAFQFASALIVEGIAPGDTVAIMTNPRVEFAIADIGTTMIGSLTAGIYVTDSSELLEYKLNHLGAKLFVMENSIVKGVPQLDKVLSIPRARLPKLERIAVIGEYDNEDDRRLVPFDELAADRRRLPTVSERLYELEPHMPAVIIYSSGTEGRPNGAVLTHHNIMSAIRQADSRISLKEGKRYMDFLPPAHGFGYMVRRSIEGLGATIYPSHRDTLAQDLPIVSPHILSGVPKFFMALGDRIRGRLGQVGMDVDNLADFQKQLVLRGAGLGDVELVISGAAAIPDDIVLFFRDKLGLRIDQAYGVTETSPGISINTVGEWKLGTVGKPFAGVDLAIFDDSLNALPPCAEGEIAVSGENVFTGYYNDPVRTDRVLKKVGDKTWYLTGDIGVIDEEGFLKITDRKDDMIVPLSGESISSAGIENKLVFHSRYVGYAAPFGTARPHVTAVVWSDELKEDNILNDAKEAGIEGTDIEAILRDPAFAKLLESDLRRALETGGFSDHERPRGFVFLAGASEKETTGTMKSRKKEVRKKYQEHLEALYRTGEFLKIV